MTDEVRFYVHSVTQAPNSACTMLLSIDDRFAAAFSLPERFTEEVFLQRAKMAFAMLRQVSRE